MYIGFLLRILDNSLTDDFYKFLAYCQICELINETICLDYYDICTTIHRYQIFSTSYSVICKVYTGYHGTSETEHGFCACTVDNPLDKARGLSPRTGGWSGGAMVLGKLPVPGRPTIWITVGQGPTALTVGAGGGCLDIFTLLYPFSPLSPSLW